MIDQQIHKNLEILLNSEEDLSLRIDASEAIQEKAPIDMIDIFYKMTLNDRNDPHVLYGLGSIIASIWVKLNKYNIDELYELNLHARYGFYDYVYHNHPSWLKLPEFKQLEKERIDVFVEILLDQECDIGARDDVAMVLSEYDDDNALAALIQIATDPDEDDFMMAACGESIGTMWAKRNFFDEQVYVKLHPHAKWELKSIIKLLNPELAQKITPFISEQEKAQKKKHRKR